MDRHNRSLLDERGITLPLIAVSLFAMLALGALAIDLSSLRDARSEAQRAADAIALGGASAYRDFPSNDAITSDSAQSRALKVARLNMVRADTLDVRNPVASATTYGWGKVIVVETNQVTLNVIPDSQKVRAWVRHAGVATFFGGLLAKPYGHVQAMATAWASKAGPTVNCLKPFVIPDLWYESDKIEEDVDGDDYMDPIPSSPGSGQAVGESWKYEPESIGGDDYYLPYDPAVPNDPSHPQTGYGSSIRNSGGYTNDVGLPILIKPQTGDGNAQSAPMRMGNAFWLLDFGPANVRNEITSGCATASVGDPVPYESGGHTGGVKNGVRDLINLDRDARWDPSTKQVVGSNPQYGDWTKSPRVITIGLVSPEYWIANSSNAKPDAGSVFTNFVRLFLLDVEGNDNIQAIFLGPAPGSGGGPVSGPLVKTLQLIE